MNSSSPYTGVNTAPRPLQAVETLTQQDRYNWTAVADSIDADAERVLAALEKHLGPAALLNYLTEHVLREQEIFWSRFAGFAAIHGGTLVLLTSTSVSTANAKTLISVIGLVLGVLWVIIQAASVVYADRAKRLYHWYRSSLGILWPYEWKELEEGRKPFSLRTLASTRLAVAVPALVTVLWILALA